MPKQPDPISPEIGALTEYLEARAIPTAPEYLKAHGIEFAGAEKIAQVLGFPPPARAVGIIYNYPGTDYATVRLVPGGPLCPKGSTPRAYLCRHTDWDTVQGALVICESPLKALTWAEFGYHALASGGVTTVYMPRRDQWCEGFPHAAIESGAIHTVLIAWDSDIEDNHNVAKAQRVLARALADRHPGVEVKIQVLPPPPEDFGKEHWGCDDARAYHGNDWFGKWAGNPDCTRAPERDALQDHLDQLSERYVVALSESKVIDLHNGNLYTDGAFCRLVEGWRTVPGERRPIKVAPLWLESSARPTVTGLTYVPGAPVIHGDQYNIWRPSEVIPRAGDVSPWLELLDDAIRDKEVMKLMLECMSYQVQNRDSRLEKLLYFVGRQVGTGKSTQAVIMKRILGVHNTGWVTKDDLESPYNSSWAAKELVVMDDITKLRRGTWGKLKTHITSDEVQITEKYMTARMQKNYATFYVTGNQADILTTDAEDRRVLMIPFEPTRVHRERNDPYWPGFHHWLETGGIEAIAHYLGTYNNETFDAQFYPPESDLKESVIEATRDEDENWLREFQQSPLDFLPRDRRVITTTELWLLYSGEEPSAYNKESRKRFSNIAAVITQLTRAVPGVFHIGQQRTRLYWVPGHEPKTKTKLQEREIRRLRINIKKYPIKLPTKQ